MLLQNIRFVPLYYEIILAVVLFARVLKSLAFIISALGSRILIRCYTKDIWSLNTWINSSSKLCIGVENL